MLGGEAGDAEEAWEAWDALLGYSSSLWVGGLFQARFHWLLEAVDDALFFFFGASSFGVAWEVEMKGDDSLCRDLWGGGGCWVGDLVKEAFQGKPINITPS